MAGAPRFLSAGDGLVEREAAPFLEKDGVMAWKMKNGKLPIYHRE